MALEKKYIGSDCHIRMSPKGTLARNDDSMSVPLSRTEYKILSYFADRMDCRITLEQLAIFLWGPNYDVDEKHPESVRSQITRIRKKLNEISPALASRLETIEGFGSYTFKADLQDTLLEVPCNTSEPEALFKELFTFNQQMDVLVSRLEKLQAKIERAKREKNVMWQEIYAAQFEAAYDLFMQLRQEIFEKQNSTDKLSLRVRNYMEAQQYAGEKTSENAAVINQASSASAYTPDTLIQAESELVVLRDWLANAELKIHDIENQLIETTADTEQQLQQLTTIHQATYFDLIELGYTSMSIAESLVQNDWKLYGGLGASSKLTQENEGSALQWAEFLSSVPDSFRYLLNKDNQIVGNFSFVSISQEQEADFMEGNLSESMFNPADTRDLFCAGDDHILFLLNLSVNDEYSTPTNNSILRQMFLSQLLLFAEADVLFSKIIVNVFKASHEAFFKQWGFSFVKNHKISGRIYELSLRPYPDKLYNQLKKNRYLKEINEKLKSIYGEQSHVLSKSL